MIDIKNLTIEKAHESLKNGEYTVSQLLGEYLKNIKEKNKELNAYLEVYSDTEDQALRAQEMFANGTATLLTGIPIALKDNILREGFIASASSKILENHKAIYDAFVIKKLKSEGAVFIGRTNMDEFAMGSSTETSGFGVTKNPYDTSLVPGGSSGGSAVSVASGMALAALGTETCGSVRQPASFCGLVGLKPSYGAVSRSGIIAMGSSLDQVGPMGRTVRDVEIIFNSITGHDPNDSTSVKDEMRKSPSPLKKIIGVPRSLVKEGVEKEVLENFNASLEKLKSAGYEIVDINLPILKYSLAVYYVIMPAEVSSNLARYDGMRYGLSVDAPTLYDVYAKTRGVGFGREARRRILLGTYILSHGYYDAYYNKAVTVRNAISRELSKAFLDIDVFVTPTVPFPPFKLGEKINDPLAMYLCDVFSAPANLAGISSISIPSGKNSAGLPMAIQFTAPYLCEEYLFNIGKDFEKLV